MSNWLVIHPCKHCWLFPLDAAWKKTSTSLIRFLPETLTYLKQYRSLPSHNKIQHGVWKNGPLNFCAIDLCSVRTRDDNTCRRFYKKSAHKRTRTRILNWQNRIGNTKRKKRCRRESNLSIEGSSTQRGTRKMQRMRIIVSIYKWISTKWDEMRLYSLETKYLYRIYIYADVVS